ncbi:hypothetical protein AAVH_09009 [Aphelenchoides avenae]|nr:hypothetical protein AAVH_09009 [Aphelenchus avenae]
MIHLFQSLKHTQVERVLVDSELFGIDNLSASMNVARVSCSVGTFELVNFYDLFTVHQMVRLLRDPAAVASDKIVVRTWTPTFTDYSMMEDFLFSTKSPAFVLRLFRWLEMPFPPTSLLTLPTRFLQRFLDAKDTTNVISEFHLVLHKFEGAAFVDLPPTHRMKQFRHNRYGKEVTSRVHMYRNAYTGDVLSALRQVDRTYYNSILFLKGQISLDNLRSKWTNDKY